MKNAKNTVLIVEDEADLRQLLKMELVNEGFNVLEAENGKVGLEISLKQYPNIILLDIIMPVMDGFSMLAELRKNEWGKNVPVIILTNLREAEKTNRDVEKNVCDYLVKSDLEPEDIVRLVKKRIKENKQ